MMRVGREGLVPFQEYLVLVYEGVKDSKSTLRVDTPLPLPHPISTAVISSLPELSKSGIALHFSVTPAMNSTVADRPK